MLWFKKKDPPGHRTNFQKSIDQNQSFFFWPYHLQPSASNIFIAFPVFALKKFFCTSSKFIFATSCHHFVCFGWLVALWCTYWLLHIPKVRNFWKLLGHHSYKEKYSKNKIKSRPPTSYTEKTVHEKHIINYFGLSMVTL